MDGVVLETSLMTRGVSVTVTVDSDDDDDDDVAKKWWGWEVGLLIEMGMILNIDDSFSIFKSG